MNSEKPQTVDQLNSFLRGEMSAVEAYRQALDRVRTLTIRTTLEQCAKSHDLRVQALTEAVTRLGGTPSHGSGAWGALAQTVEAGAILFGEKEAILALEEGENHGLRDYLSDLDNLDVESRELVAKELLPKQKETQATVANLKKAMTH